MVSRHSWKCLLTGSILSIDQSKPRKIIGNAMFPARARIDEETSIKKEVEKGTMFRSSNDRPQLLKALEERNTPSHLKRSVSEMTWKAKCAYNGLTPLERATSDLLNIMYGANMETPRSWNNIRYPGTRYNNIVSALYSMLPSLFQSSRERSWNWEFRPSDDLKTLRNFWKVKGDLLSVGVSVVRIWAFSTPSWILSWKHFVSG